MCCVWNLSWVYISERKVYGEGRRLVRKKCNKHLYWKCWLFSIRICISKWLEKMPEEFCQFDLKLLSHDFMAILEFKVKCWEPDVPTCWWRHGPKLDSKAIYLGKGSCKHGFHADRGDSQQFCTLLNKRLVFDNYCIGIIVYLKRRHFQRSWIAELLYEFLL